MAIEQTANVLPTQTWVQLDKRDPLGIWGGRHGITGDATGGSIKTIFQIPQLQRAAFVFACYGITYAQTTGAAVTSIVKARLLTNWPNADEQAGVRGYATNNIVTVGGSGNFTAPLAGPAGGERLLQSTDRFILMYDPRAGATGDMGLVEIELAANQDGSDFAFEVWGYYWDRSVMEAPGGPRHPGSA